jgi:hypothetical protein
MTKKLISRVVDSITKPGRAAVSEYLFLQVGPRHDGWSWFFLYLDRLTGILRDKGLG